jgi:hypothetical protein
MIAVTVVSIASDDPLEFDVILREGNSESRYAVTMKRRALKDLAPNSSAEACVEAAFRFLLDREPKESILKRFDIAVIAHYFPEFGHALPQYLPRGDSAGR